MNTQNKVFGWMKMEFFWTVCGLLDMGDCMPPVSSIGPNARLHVQTGTTDNLAAHRKHTCMFKHLVPAKCKPSYSTLKVNQKWQFPIWFAGHDPAEALLNNTALHCTGVNIVCFTDQKQTFSRFPF